MGETGTRELGDHVIHRVSRRCALSLATSSHVCFGLYTIYSTVIYGMYTIIIVQVFTN